MSEFDSRLLRYTDCFGQKLDTKGKYQFSLGIKPQMRLMAGGDHKPAEVEVDTAGAGKKPAQRHLPVRFKDGEFTPDAELTKAATGDIVTWSGADASTPPFEVDVRTPSAGTIGSGHMHDGALVTHAFLMPGIYEWRIGDQRKAGTITVDQVIARDKAAFDAWVKSVSEGPLVRIVEGKPDKTDIRIPVGGTVCWTVEKSTDLWIVVEATHPRD